MAVSALDDHAHCKATLSRGVEIGMDLVDSFDSENVSVPESIAALAYVVACAIDKTGRAKAERSVMQMLGYMIGTYLDGLEQTEEQA